MLPRCLILSILSSFFLFLLICFFFFFFFGLATSNQFQQRFSLVSCEKDLKNGAIPVGNKIGRKKEKTTA